MRIPALVVSRLDALHGRSLLLTDRLPALRGSDGKFTPTPIIDDYNRLAEHVGCKRPGHRMTLFTTAADEAAADRVWEKFGLHPDQQVVALNPGAAFVRAAPAG